MKKKITTEIFINASIETVWEILTDFDKYPYWNPFIESIEGNVSPGEILIAKIAGLEFKPTVISSIKNKELRWVKQLYFGGLLESEHIFQCIDNGDETTTFIQSEICTGLMVFFYIKKLDEEIKPGFELMNRILKSLAEEAQDKNNTRTNPASMAM
jgi:hypothetical protein